jgi:ESS family glutamate:Na+ symporter
MQIPFPFDSILLFGSLAVMLLVGVFFRAKVSFLQRFLIPSCLIGGALGLIVINSGLINLSVTDLETFAYHFFNISFISVGLTGNANQADQTIKKKKYWKGSLWMALTQTVVFNLQAIVGGVCVIVLGVFGFKLFPTFGFFAPLGFEEGPGQALSVGKVWEGLGFEHAATIGLTFAAIGYLFAFFIGVPLANRGIRRGLAVNAPDNLPVDFVTGVLSKAQDKSPAGEQTLHSANIDTLAFQSAMIGLVYVLTYGFIRTVGSFFQPDVATIFWGFFFLFGLLIALATRWFLGRFKVDYLIDPGVQRRITGWSIDFLIVATIMAIKLTIVWAYILPISVISICCGAVTTVTMVYLGKRLWSYNLERTVAIFGAVTGTVSCGLLLLRIVDPEFKSPAVIEIALMNAIAIVPIAGLLLLVNAPVWWDWSLLMTLLAFTFVLVTAAILMKIFKLLDKPESA